MSTKKKLSQEELRKVMINTKKKLGIEKKKIDSPLAKYNSAGQITCVICKTLVGNETAWTIHINSKKHKEIVILAKRELEKAKSTVSTPKRSSSPFQEPQPVKKVKGILKNLNYSLNSINQVHQKSKTELPDDFYDKPTSPSKDNVGINTNSESQKLVNTAKTVETGQSEGEKEEERCQSGKENPAPLPEGFFDDPVLDAKVRNVEYKDPIEEEWEKFKREIKEEEAQANQIIADDQEEATARRQEDVIEEQMQRLSKVIDLVKLREEMKAAEKRAEIVENESSSSDDDDFDEFLDWRAKKSYE